MIKDKLTKRQFNIAGKRSFEGIVIVFVVLVFFAFVYSVMSALFPSGTGIRYISNSAKGTGNSTGNTDRTLFIAQGNSERDLFEKFGAAAVLKSKNNRVKSKKADSIAWTDADLGMPLFDHDSVQTFNNSSAVVKMNEGNALHMGDNSLIIIRKIEKDLFSDKKRAFVVVMDGQLSGKLDETDYAEITTPSAIAQIESKGIAGEQTEFTIHVNPDKSTSFTVFKGVATITAQGEKVTLRSNQMTTVDIGNVPATPRTVPDPVALSYPEHGESFYFRDLSPLILFTWKQTRDADGYHFLIARDREFKDIVFDERVVKNNFSLGNLRRGTYFWRVCAIVDKGEGHYSKTREVLLVQDIEPPVLEINHLPLVVYKDKLLINGLSEPGSNVFISGEPVPLSESGAFEYMQPLQNGMNVLVVEAVDNAGNIAYMSQLVNGKF
jgi:mannose-6-phosphate isomerase-like protein (cupin superfamily)